MKLMIIARIIWKLDDKIMNINLYLDNEENTPITSFYDIASDPFNIEDEIYLDVNDLYPVEYNKYKDSVRDNLIENNNKLSLNFNRTKVRILRVEKYLNFNILKSGDLTIDYYCEFSKTK